MKRDVILITLFALMIFLFLCNFMPLGIVGDAFSQVMFGLTGFAGYFLPIFIFAVYLYYILYEGRDPKIRAKTGAVIGLFVIFMVLCHLISGDLSAEGGYDPHEIWTSCAENRNGGGILGGSIAFVLYRMLRTFGSVLILLVAAVVCIYIIGQRSFLELFRDKAMDARLAREERLAQEAREETERPARRTGGNPRPDGDDGGYEEESTSHYEESRRRYEELRRGRRMREAAQAEDRRQRIVHYRGIVGDTDLSADDGFRDANEEFREPDGGLSGREPVNAGAEPGEYSGSGQFAGTDQEEYPGRNPAAGADDTVSGPEEEPENYSAGSAAAFSVDEDRLRAVHEQEPEPDQPVQDVLQNAAVREDNASLQNRRNALRDSDELHEILPDYFENEENGEPWENGTRTGNDSGFRESGAEDRDRYTEYHQDTQEEPYAGTGVLKASVIREDSAAEGAEEDADSADSGSLYRRREEGSGDPYAGMPEIRVVDDDRADRTTGTPDKTGASVESYGGESAQNSGAAPGREIPVHTEREPGGSGINAEIEKNTAETESDGPDDRKALSGSKPQGQSAVQQSPSKPVVRKHDYVFPPLNLLHPGSGSSGDSDEELRSTAETLQTTLQNFGVSVTITDISQGPAVTRYEMLPEMGVKVSRIVSLADDIKLALAATDIRIEAPIPGKRAIGIEVPNREAKPVALRDIIDTEGFRSQKSKVAFAVGKDIAGKPVYGDIAKMPHVLIAGATGSGKSVCINTIIMSILYHAKPEEVKMIMIDPKVVELSVYNGIPHLLIPVVTNPQKAAAALNWGVAEMEARYRRFADAKVRDIKAFNREVERAKQSGDNPDDLQFMPQIVIIVDELADLMMVAKNDVETAICRLAQLARAAGIYLIIATQRPSVDVITGLIKANMPSRIAFRVSSGVDSRTILDMNGAEKLLGKGDMLFFPSGLPKPTRVQGCFVSDEEVNDVVQFVIRNNPVDAAEEQENKAHQEEVDALENGGSGESGDSGNGSAGAESHEPEQDELFGAAGTFIIEKNNASIGLLQRKYRIGFNRAARIMDQLCDAGVVSNSEGTKSRNILMTMEQFLDYCRENDIAVPEAL